MPLYEFVCDECEKPFEDLVRSSDELFGVICPICGSDSTRKKMSTFAMSGSLKTNYSFNNSGTSTESCTVGST